MTYEEFEARMEIFHFAMQMASINLSGLAMGVACNPDPKAAAICAAHIPGVYDTAKAVLADIRRDCELESNRDTGGDVT